MHEQQSNMTTNNEDLLQKHATPLPEAGNPYLTVEALHELHNRQSLD